MRARTRLAGISNTTTRSRSTQPRSTASWSENKLVEPEPKKRPKSSYIRFEAEQPNETWQSDFTHYRLADRTDVEILSWLDDHSRYALRITAHQPVTAKIVLAEFRAAITETEHPDQH